MGPACSFKDQVSHILKPTHEVGRASMEYRSISPGAAQLARVALELDAELRSSCSRLWKAALQLVLRLHSGPAAVAASPLAARASLQQAPVQEGC